MDPSQVTREHFESLVGEELEVSSETAVVTLRLAEAEELSPSDGVGCRPDPFALLLAGASGSARLEQGIHSVQHPELGELRLFLVPVRTERPEPSYEVIFN